MYMLRLYNTHTDNLFCQGHDSAPGLNIMLLKQQHLSVSGQAADPARQHPPVEYVYRSSHPLLQFLPQKLSFQIANNYAVELNMPPRPDIQHGTPSISGKKCQGEYIYMVYVLYLTCIF